MQQHTAEKYRVLYDQKIGEQEFEEAIRAKGVKVYRTRSVMAGQVLDLNICAVWNARGEAKKAAEAKRKQSAAVMEKHNAKERARKIGGLINENFGEGDFALYLSFANEADVKKALRWYIRACTNAHKKIGAAFRYLYVLECADGDGNPVRPHIHIFVDGDLPRDWYEDLWRERYGIANGTRLQPDENGLSAFAHYVQKAPRDVKRVRRWACSRNLRKPVERRSTRLPNGKTLTKKFVFDMVSGKRDLRTMLEESYPEYRFIGMEIRQSEYVSGVYIDIRMTRYRQNRKKSGERGVIV